jgi:ABC-type multidrug transport system ATPase subunit
LVRGVKKQYRSLFDAKFAVRGITFGVEEGSIFAFLGTNGAGKTTTFKMLTGELLPS